MITSYLKSHQVGMRGQGRLLTLATRVNTSMNMYAQHANLKEFICAPYLVLVSTIHLLDLCISLFLSFHYSTFLCHL